MLRFSTSRIVAVVSLATLVGASTYAVNLVTGSSLNVLGVNSATLPTLTGGTLIASVSTPFASTVWSGTLYTTVIRETTGTLSFLYQVKVNPLAPGDTVDYIARLTTTKFGSFTVDADYISNAFTGFGFVAPVGVTPHPYVADRATTDKIGFVFNSGAADDGLAKGETSNVLYVRTNAYRYTRGLTSVIDGDVARVNTFAPAPGVPGPAALLPFGVGLVAAFMRRRRN